MRISRYYPLIGYQKDRETEDEHIRKEYKLGKLDKLKKAEARKYSETILLIWI